MKYLITGGCGFLGANLGSAILEQGAALVVVDDMSRVGSEENLAWLRSQGEFEFHHADVRVSADMDKLLAESHPDVAYHLAGQVAMTTSMANPRLDFETNAVGTFNLLEAVRLRSPQTIVVYSSTNKVYGDLEYLTYEEQPLRFICQEYPGGFPETLTLDFHSPYGCSKGAADQYVLDYARMFDLQTVVFRHSSMFGGRQFSTFDQGWIGWFVEQAIKIGSGALNDTLTVSGTGKQVRDLLHADDVVKLYLTTPEHIDRMSGQAFNIGGGIDNSFSILELFKFLEVELDVEIRFERLPTRASDQRVFVADTTKINACTGWAPAISREEGVRDMIRWAQGRDA